MALKLFVFIALFVLCSSGLALKINEEIKVNGYGQISAETDQDSVYDRVHSYGDDQVYSRKLTSGDFEQGKLETTYTYRNSKNINDINVSGRYEAGLKMPDGVHHSIWVQSNKSIDSTSTMSYVNGDLVVGSTNFDWEAQNANLSEDIRDFSLGKDEFVASTTLKGNFSLTNELEESQRICTAGVLLEMLDATEIRGFNQVEEVQSKGPRTIIIDGKTAPADVQASYLQRDAADLITSAIKEQDDIKRRNNFTAALTLIDKALDLNPNDAGGYHNRGAALYGLNRKPEAIKAYEKSIALDKTNPTTIFELAQLFFTNKQYGDSIVYFDMGLPLDPAKDGGVYWRNLAQAHYQLRDYSEAEKAIDEYISRTPPDPEPLFFKALIQYENQSYQGAVESYEKAFGLVSESSQMEKSVQYANRYLYLGDAYLKLAKGDAYSKNFVKAKEILNKAETLNPDLKDTAEGLIRSIDPNPAGSTPAETAQTASPENLTSQFNLTRPVNGS